jgi:hypothetical protein
LRGVVAGNDNGMQAPASDVLREYALLADGHRGILVGPHGDLAWCCFPRWDSPAVFSALLGAAGFYSIRPRGRHTWGGFYEPGSLIWRSRWVTDDGPVECREALGYPGSSTRAIILRQLSVADGAAEVEVRLQLRRQFGRTAPTHLRKLDDGWWAGRLGDLHVRWSGVPGARYDERSGTFTAKVRLEAGQRCDIVLELSTEECRDFIDPAETWSATEQAWRSTAPEMSGTLADRDARHAVAVLCGMTGPDGAMVAAGTTSLPERSGGSRDYDYRYAWIRDQCYVGQAGAAAGVDSLVDAAVRFVGQRLRDDGANLRPAYCVDGAPVPAECDVDVPGYPGAPKTVVGNRAGAQFQLDVFGEALLLFAAAERCDRLDGEGWAAAVAAAEAIERRWQEPDAGVWETHPVRRFAHSRLACAAGLRAVAAVAKPGQQTAHWSALADALVADVSANCLHPTGRWQRAPDDDRCDAALLTAQIRGLIRPEDPRSIATRAAVCESLVQDGYVYRYQVDDRPLGTDEGAFMLCGYWLAMAMHQAGDIITARAHFERTRAGCGPAGLFTEEYDVAQRQMRGNFPQAFVHAAMLEASVRLSQEP